MCIRTDSCVAPREGFEPPTRGLEITPGVGGVGSSGLHIIESKTRPFGAEGLG